MIYHLSEALEPGSFLLFFLQTFFNEEGPMMISFMKMAMALEPWVLLRPLSLGLVAAALIGGQYSKGDGYDF